MVAEQGCDVCGAPAQGVASSVFGPVSFAFCSRCLQVGAEPYAFLVTRAAEVGGRHRAPAAAESIAATLAILGRSLAQFDHDVAQTCVLRRESRQGITEDGLPLVGAVVVCEYGESCYVGIVRSIGDDRTVEVETEAGETVRLSAGWFVPRPLEEEPSVYDRLLECASNQDLLSLNARTMAILRRRGVLRTNNSPVGDWAEHLVEQRLGFALAQNSAADYDAEGPDGRRYQIKARRLTAENTSRQLGAIRNLKDGSFDYLIAILFDEEYQVREAYMIPLAVVVAYAKRRERTNSYRIDARGAILSAPGVTTITDRLMDDGAIQGEAY